MIVWEAFDLILAYGHVYLSSACKVFDRMSKRIFVEFVHILLFDICYDSNSSLTINEWCCIE